MELFGAARVEAEWAPDSRMRVTLRRLARRAREAAARFADGAGIQSPGRR